jgi:AAA+ ATPase superfamily predicted ATPase
MRIYLKEKIGNPELFTGRKRELTFYLNWIDRIKQESSLSSAILSRRKTGKTALLQRFYNLTFDKDMGVIPFYYEVKEGKQWVVEFCQDFYLTFLYQYMACITRTPEYVEVSRKPEKDFVSAMNIARQEGLESLLDSIRGIAQLVEDARAGLLWDAVRETPWTLAAQQRESIVQIIDEIQYLNSEMYWDEAKTNQADDLASGYMRTAEYKNAPFWYRAVGWAGSSAC